MKTVSHRMAPQSTEDINISLCSAVRCGGYSSTWKPL